MSGRVWVVTGASSGFGLAISLYALQQGEKVITTIRNPSKFPESLKAAGAHPLYLDMSSSDEVVKKAAEDAIGVYGHVDVLVNNAATISIGHGPRVICPRTADIRSLFQVNLFAAVTFTQPFITHFRTRRSGHILNISSDGSFEPHPTWDAYSAAKAALNTFTQTLARELQLFGVKVHLVLPGYFPTEIWPVDVEEAGFKLSKVYTDPETQGYDSVRLTPRYAAEEGRIGDTEKLAVRIFEVVAGTGLVGEVINEVNRPEWIWVPLGSRSGERGTRMLADRSKNFKAYERVWRATDVDPERLAEFRAKAGLGNIDYCYGYSGVRNHI